MSVGPLLEESVGMTVDLDKHQVDGSKLGLDTPRCYVPVFVADPGSQKDVLANWFLGNMFLDLFVVVHDMEGAKVGGAKPKIGLYDKLDPHVAPNIIPPGPHGPDGPDGPTGTGGVEAWVVVLIILAVIILAVLIKLFGKQCLNKARGRANTFQPTANTLLNQPGGKGGEDLSAMKTKGVN